MQNKKKVAAAIAAVMYYLKAEEEAIRMQAAAVQGKPVSAPAAALNPWGSNGRQTMMQMRNLMQMRTFHRI